MSRNPMGSPPDDVGAEPREAGPNTENDGYHTTQTTPHDSGYSQRVCDGLLRQLGRRRRAAARAVPLDCGCRDPWTCDCTEPPLSEHALDAWAAASEHILAGGRMPLVPIEVRRALYRRGGHDRALAELLHEGCGGVAS